MAFEHFDKRPVATRERLLEYVIEVAGRLMSVDDEN
jgi:hypothetical protein